ncbi:MAG: hypothetical protein AAF416_14395 [Pseudomonadota bacterium]
MTEQATPASAEETSPDASPAGAERAHYWAEADAADAGESPPPATPQTEKDEDTDDDRNPDAGDSDEGGDDEGGEKGSSEPAEEDQDDSAKRIAELEAKLRDNEQRLASEMGRSTSFQQKYEALRRQQPADPKPAAEAPKPSDQDAAKAASERMAAITEKLSDYDLADVATYMREQQAEIEALRTGGQQVEALERQLGEMASGYERLTFDSRVQTPPTNDELNQLASWVSAKGGAHYDAWARNAHGIVNGAEAADLVLQFRQERAGQSASTDATATPPAADPKRRKQAEAIAAPPKRSPSIRPGAPRPNDVDRSVHWDFWDKEEKAGRA